MATISDQAVNTYLPALQQFGAVCRFDIAAGDFDGDAYDEIALVVSDPAQSPGTNLVLQIYDCDTLNYDLDPKDSFSFTANSDGDHPCLRNVLMETGNFEPDSLDEITILDSWSRGDVDSSRVGTLHTLKLNTALTGFDDPPQAQSLPPCSWHNNAGLNGTVRAMTTYAGELIVGGTFTAAGGFSANNIASWDGARWKRMGTGVDGTVEALEVYEDALIVGGSFTQAGGVAANNLARWDGSSWEEFGGGADSTVYDLLATTPAVSSQSLFACGDFTTIGVLAAQRIARWGFDDTWHTVGGNPVGLNARAMKMMERGGRLEVTGDFDFLAQPLDPHYRIAWWSPGNPNAWGTTEGDRGINATGRALANVNGYLYVGGDFWEVWGAGFLGFHGWVSANHLAYWNTDDLTDHWSGIGSGLTAGIVNDLLFNSSTNDLYIGGTFTNAGGTGAGRIARFATNTSTWYTLGSGVTASSGAEVQELCFYDGDLIAGGKFDHAGGIDAGNIARWDNSQWYPLFDPQPPMFSFGLAVGRFNADSELDDIAIAAWRSESGILRQYLRVYEVDTLEESPLMLSERGETILAGYRTNSELARSRRLIAIDDITGDGQADLAMLSSQLPGRIEIYEPCDIVEFCWFNPMSQTASWNSSSVNLTQLVLADLDTVTTTLGPPTAYHVDSVLQPLAIINAPPVHYDILDGDTADISRRYPYPIADDQFDTYVEYINSTVFTLTTTTELHRDWGMSRSLKLWVDVAGSGFDDSLKATREGRLKEWFDWHETITVGQEITARDDDQVLFVGAACKILEYPVFHGGGLVGHVLVTSPTYTGKVWNSAESERWLMPNHEVDNVLSYPRYPDISTNRMMASGPIGGGMTTTWTMNGGSRSTWFLAYQTFENSGVTESWDVSVAEGGTKTVGLEFTGSAETEVTLFGCVGVTLGISTEVSTGVSVGLEGYYDVGQISTFSTTFEENDTLRVNYGLIQTGSSADSTDTRYRVTPYAYWAKNGALVIDFAADPQTHFPGETPSWWQDKYSDPDPAFILPWRLENEKRGGSAPEEDRHQTKEIFFFPGHPAPGDSIIVGARVHNFSLVDILNPVAVSFYLGNPDNGGVILHDKNSGDSVFYTRDTDGMLVGVGAQDYALTMMMWQVPYVGSISECQRIWAVIDPMDDISPEVHDNDDWATNNKGWKLLYVETPRVCIDTDPDGYGHYDGYGDPAFRCHTCTGIDNCPTVYNPDQKDNNFDGIGDACQSCCFGRVGNVNGLGTYPNEVTISDIQTLVTAKFIQGTCVGYVSCIAEGDVNQSGGADPTCNDITISDIQTLVNHLFIAGPVNAPLKTCL
jgi:hypothetical protein